MRCRRFNLPPPLNRRSAFPTIVVFSAQLHRRPLQLGPRALPQPDAAQGKGSFSRNGFPPSLPPSRVTPLYIGVPRGDVAAFSSRPERSNRRCLFAGLGYARTSLVWPFGPFSPRFSLWLFRAASVGLFCDRRFLQVLEGRFSLNRTLCGATRVAIRYICCRLSLRYRWIMVVESVVELRSIICFCFK